MIRLNILSPERKLLESKEVREVTLPGSEGEFQIMPGHVPMAGTLETGMFSYPDPDASQGGVIYGFLSTGFFEVHSDEVNVMAEVLELSHEIDLDRAREAQKKAEEQIKTSEDQENFRKYQFKLQRSLIRQQVAGK